ncbi:hypothetical protein [Sphingomonas sp.]|uniref:hypothetical protein n=1 Tax=Sphingomonas sp. TaxID=28214 RepID=UPI00286E23EB|nr:hypothetical protein [Sphingomonas sp.]
MIRPAPGKRRARFILPGLYLALALYVWFDFATAARDGLANLGLFLVTAPVAAVGLLIDSFTTGTRFSLLPDGFGYLGNHAIYYVPAVSVTAGLMFLLGRKIDRRPN